MLDPVAFEQWFVGFTASFTADGEGLIVVDGKTLRRSNDRAEERSPLHLVSAWAAEQRLALGGCPSTTSPMRLSPCPSCWRCLLYGARWLPRFLTNRAMHCQRQIAEQVVEQGGDYVLALKGNQGSLHEDAALFPDDGATPTQQDTQVSKGHGRIDTRIANNSADVSWLQQWYDWPGLQAVGKVRAIRRKDDQASEQTRYYLLSTALEPARFNAVVRGHWRIENGLHWALDATCNEGQAHNRTGHCAENVALLRKLSLNLARLEPSKGSMRGTLKRAGWDDSFLISILSQFSNIHAR